MFPSQTSDEEELAFWEEEQAFDYVAEVQDLWCQGDREVQMTTITQRIYSFLERFFCKGHKNTLEAQKKSLEAQEIEIKHYVERIAELESAASEMNMEDFWNARWAKATITYKATPVYTNVDVRSVFNVEWDDETKLRQITKSWEKLSYDEIAKKALNYVIGKVTYRDDQTAWKTPEYWQDAGETLQRKSGDCEDGAIMIMKLLQFAGVPAWRRKLCAGWVQANPQAPEGGHAYAIYLADDGQWYALDWCYYPTKSVKAFLKVPHKGLDYYKDIWWTTNEQYSWAQKDFKIIEELKP